MLILHKNVVLYTSPNYATDRHTVTLSWIRGSEGIKSIVVSAGKLY